MTIENWGIHEKIKNYKQILLLKLKKKVIWIIKNEWIIKYIHHDNKTQISVTNNKVYWYKQSWNWIWILLI